VKCEVRVVHVVRVRHARISIDDCTEWPTQKKPRFATRRKAKKTPGSRRASRGRIIENHTHSVLNETFIVSRLLSSKSRATLCDGRAFRSVRERGRVGAARRVDDAKTHRFHRSMVFLNR